MRASRNDGQPREHISALRGPLTRSDIYDPKVPGSLARTPARPRRAGRGDGRVLAPLPIMKNRGP